MEQVPERRMISYYFPIRQHMALQNIFQKIINAEFM